jgi:exopolysaccharide biosynthesis polyprenyl glycosylphosphotransferase
MDDLKGLVEDLIVDDVLFAVPFSALLSAEPHVAWCEEVGVTVHLKVDFIRTLFSRTYPSELDGMPMLTMSTTPQDAVALLLKRTVDFVVSSVMLVGLSPLLALCALAVKTTSPGSVYFRQQRVGLNGRIFTLLKFRSMYRDAEERRKELERLNEASGPVFKMRRDPRITPVGRLLRRFSLDELPQLWNVFRGDMSLVGPRPPLPDEVRRYERWQRRRLSMKPGLTCLWQVAGRSNIGFDEWMKLDLAYIDNWSLKLDFVILLRTVPAVVLARGAR